MNAVKCGGDHSTLKSSLLKEQSYGFVGIVGKKKTNTNSQVRFAGVGERLAQLQEPQKQTAVFPHEA